MFDNISRYGVISEAFNAGNCVLNIYDLRDFTRDRHRKVDDRPYGGGPGMVLMAEPLERAINHIKKKNAIREKDLQNTVLLTPRGEVLKQGILKELSSLKNII